MEAAGLPFDLVAVLPRHLEHVDHLAERFPDLTIVIDHLASRRSAATDISLVRADGAGGDRSAGGRRAVGTLSSWRRPIGQDDDLRPWIADAIQLFGPDRLLVGSDWPVAESAGGYRSVTGSVIRVVRDLLDDSDATRVLADTATAVYGLGPTSKSAEGFGAA